MTKIAKPVRVEKKVKTRPYSILIQKSKGSSAFDEQKVKNIAIEYRLQLIFPNPKLGYTIFYCEPELELYKPVLEYFLLERTQTGASQFV